MAIWPFNRKKEQSSDLPQEVQEYYQAEKRERVGVAGLLALGTLVVTIGLAIGLFFGGRWAYRSLFNKDKQTASVNQTKDTSEEQNNSSESKSSSTSNSTSSNNSSTPNSSTSNNSTSNSASNNSSSSTNNSSSSNNSSNNSGSTSSSSTPSTQSTSSTGSKSDLPSTGPADTVAIFLGTIVLATTGFYFLGAKKLTS